MWGAALGEDWGAVLGDLDCGTLQCGLWGWEGWGAQLPRGSKGETRSGQGLQQDHPGSPELPV